MSLTGQIEPLSAARTASLVRRRIWTSSDWPAVLFVVIVVVLGNVLYLLHFFDPNPINTLSSLGTNIHKGLSPGLFYIDPNVGYTSQALGHRAALDLLHGHVPWWNHDEGIGTPLAGEMQSASLFPPTLLLAFSTGQLYFHMVLEATAGISTVLLLRRLRLSRLIAATGGAAFALNGTYAWLLHSPANPLAFLPLALLGVEITAQQHEGPSRNKGWILLAIALALSLYAGSPETAFIDGLLVAVWSVVRAVQLRSQRWKGFLVRLLVGAGAGLLLAAPILVPFIDYLRQGDIGGHSQVFATYTEPGSSMPPFLLPYVYGPIFAWYSRNPSGPLTVFWDSAGGYFTAVLCLLAILGAWGRRERGLKIGLAVWVLIGIARTFGVGPALTLVNLIPGVKSTAFFRYAPASWELALVVLAAFGIEEVAQRKRLLVIATAATGMLIAIAIAYHDAQPALRSVLGAPHNRAWAIASAGWGAVTVVAVLAACLLRRPTIREGAIGVVVVLNAGLMFAVPQVAAPRGGAVDTKPVAYLRSHLGSYRFFTLGPLSPNYGSYYGIASAAVNDLPAPKKYASYIKSHLNDNADPITFTGVDELDWSRPGYAAELISHLDGYRNVGVKYVLAPAGTRLPTAPDGTVLTPVFSDGQVEILYLPGAKPYFTGSVGCSVREVSWELATTDCAAPSVIMRRELSMPGWHATVNGKDAAVGQSQGLFQTVRVPAGRSTIRFDFAPPNIDLAYGAFGLGVLVLFAPAISSATARRRRVESDRRNGRETD